MGRQDARTLLYNIKEQRIILTVLSRQYFAGLYSFDAVTDFVAHYCGTCGLAIS